MSETAVLTVLVAVIGSGGFGTLVSWVLGRVDRLRTGPTVEDIREINEKLDRDWQHMQRQDEAHARLAGEVRDVNLTVLRQCLFAHPRDRNAHESALQSGEQYLAKGGNGVGHVRLEWLRDQYRLRLERDDWDYTHDMEEDI